METCCYVFKILKILKNAANTAVADSDNILSIGIDNFII